MLQHNKPNNVCLESAIVARQVNSLVRYGTVPEMLDLAAEGNRTCYASDDYNSGTLHTVRSPLCSTVCSCKCYCATLQHRLAKLLCKHGSTHRVDDAALAGHSSPSCAWAQLCRHIFFGCVCMQSFVVDVALYERGLEEGNDIAHLGRAVVLLRPSSLLC